MTSHELIHHSLMLNSVQELSATTSHINTLLGKTGGTCVYSSCEGDVLFSVPVA
jgi:hypothetical protein